MKRFCERGQRCSCWFDGLPGISWASACKLHDWRYLTVRGRGFTRKQADIELRLNVAKSGKGWKNLITYPMSWIMYVGVRIGGGSSWAKNETKRNS